MPSSEVISPIAPAGDAELVAACLAGDRNAFSRIVERYQRLLCSLAYSATGRLSQSEDVAQETFVEAWRQLASLREPDKLRPWLCGILRNKVSRLRRDDRREPVRQADTLEAAAEIMSGEDPIPDLTIQHDEQAILWAALQRLPELYREPLVLYYREHRSVEHVAAALELTEDNVKQRLARGRKILQEQVLAFVEGALVRSTPGKVFTISVLASLPELVTPARAATVGAVVAHSGTLVKTTSIAALLASISGVVSAVLTLRTGLDQARTVRERRAVVQTTLLFFFGALGFLVVLFLLRSAAFRWWEHRLLFAGICQVLVLASVVFWPAALLRTMRRMRELRSAERVAHPEAFRDARDQVGSAAGEYRSRWRLFGVPLVHTRFASPDAGARPVFGWFAGGDRAYGLVFAWGGLAVAPVSVGAVAVGLLAVGSLSVGVISLGTVGVGLLALGCVSVGVNAFAWLSALGWDTARSGGFALARVAAEGPVALAEHTNSPITRKILENPHAERDQMIFYIVVALLSLVPVSYYARAVRQRLGGAKK